MNKTGFKPKKDFLKVDRFQQFFLFFSRVANRAQPYIRQGLCAGEQKEGKMKIINGESFVDVNLIIAGIVYV